MPRIDSGGRAASASGGRSKSRYRTTACRPTGTRSRPSPRRTGTPTATWRARASSMRSRTEAPYRRQRRGPGSGGNSSGPRGHRAPRTAASRTREHGEWRRRGGGSHPHDVARVALDREHGRLDPLQRRSCAPPRRTGSAACRSPHRRGSAARTRGTRPRFAGTDPQLEIKVVHPGLQSLRRAQPFHDLLATGRSRRSRVRHPARAIEHRACPRSGRSPTRSPPTPRPWARRGRSRPEHLIHQAVREQRPQPRRVGA